jgi:hypothetical protein
MRKLYINVARKQAHWRDMVLQENEEEEEEEIKSITTYAIETRAETNIVY